jgi:hypothetical protein
MSEDPRWLEAVALLQNGLAANEAGDAIQFIRLFDQYCRILESIGGDPKATEDDRAEAKAILDGIAVQCRAATPDALRRLGEIAGDPSVDADVRAGAKKTLSKAVEQLPPASDKHH